MATVRHSTVARVTNSTTLTSVDKHASLVPVGWAGGAGLSPRKPRAASRSLPPLQRSPRHGRSASRYQALFVPGAGVRGLRGPGAERRPWLASSWSIQPARASAKASA